MALVIEHCLVDFLLRVDDERTVLDDFLVEWETGDEDCDRTVLALYLRREKARKQFGVDAVRERLKNRNG